MYSAVNARNGEGGVGYKVLTHRHPTITSAAVNITRELLQPKPAHEIQPASNTTPTKVGDGIANPLSNSQLAPTLHLPTKTPATLSTIKDPYMVSTPTKASMKFSAAEVQMPQGKKTVVAHPPITHLPDSGALLTASTSGGYGSYQRDVGSLNPTYQHATSSIVTGLSSSTSQGVTLSQSKKKSLHPAAASHQTHESLNVRRMDSQCM